MWLDIPRVSVRLSSLSANCIRLPISPVCLQGPIHQLPHSLVYAVFSGLIIEIFLHSLIRVGYRQDTFFRLTSQTIMSRDAFEALECCCSHCQWTKNSLRLAVSTVYRLAILSLTPSKVDPLFSINSSTPRSRRISSTYNRSKHFCLRDLHI